MVLHHVVHLSSESDRLLQLPTLCTQTIHREQLPCLPLPHSDPRGVFDVQPTLAQHPPWCCTTLSISRVKVTGCHSCRRYAHRLCTESSCPACPYLTVTPG